MKKFLILLITIMFLLSLFIFTGCNNKNDNTLRVGMDLRFFPFTGMDKDGKPAGVEVDIAEALGEYMQKEVEIINTEFSMLIPALQSGEIDIIIGSMTISEDREKTVDFSKPYLYEKIVAMLNKDFAEAYGINNEMSIEELFSISSTRFIGIAGSIAVSIPQSYGFEVKMVTGDAVAEREVATGGADALVGTYVLYGMHNTNKSTTVMYTNAIESAATGMAVKEGNTGLINTVNDFIAQMESSGLNDQLREDWDAEIAKKLFNNEMTLDYYLSLD
ncbi:MAG: transporter substrate-binding domain-containing protein [Spirochaetales bacterium]|uniref:Transporter substrate-binding domain-containing protein n=1 Tax=Candidatus Thalassospirochaeta sargassi TaxID=3119039 RepID=A0AAJ1IE37_9SPIO|nr:transporter substrate-binding domain-containing protein [Spirochaetales bacterium]